MKIIKEFILDLINNKRIIKELVARDIKDTHIGSLLGFMWTFIQPLALTMIFMLVFGFGFRSTSPVGDVPFVVWFLCALFPWNFFGGTLNQNLNSINSFSYLVKKVKFRISIIPLVKIISQGLIHLVFILILIIILNAYGVYPTFYWIQFIYYFIATLLLLTGLSWLFSAINVFVKDVGKIIAIFIQLGFFATPIFWRLDSVAESYRFIFKLNPMYYVVTGYRDSFINQIAFWERPELTIYFWSFTLISLFLGIIVFVRLRPHFADVV